MSYGELYIEGVLADSMGSVPVPITYSVADVRRPETRTGTGSKTIVIPGTKTNNLLLTHIYDINYDIQTSGTTNFSPDFNPNLKARAEIMVDGLTVFYGYMKLLDIKRDQQDLSRINYEIQLVGDFMNLFNDIGDKLLTDLSFSEYNHTYNKVNQEATWTNTNYGVGYVYPMINYGDVTNSSSWDVNNFYPAIYAKTYVDKIFLAAGWTYTSSFFTSSFFKRLIIPFSGEKLALTAAQIQERLFSANTSAVTSGSVTMTGAESSIGFNQRPLVFNNETLDPGGNYNPATGLFTCGEAGTYSFYTSGVARATADTVVALGGVQIYGVTVVVEKNGVTFSSQSIVGPTQSSYLAGQNIFTEVWEHNAGVVLAVGDTVNIDVSMTIPVSAGSGTVTFSLLSGALFKNTLSSTVVVDGNDLDMNGAVVKEVKQRDLLSSIMRLFNLYCEVDKNVPNNLLIETYDDFYDSGNTYDWSKKLDVARGVNITPMGALDARRYRITYAQDGDYWNKLYTDTFKETYGEKYVDVVNDFLTNTNTNEVLFAPTPLIGTNAHDRVIPEIYQVTSSGAKQKVRSKPRLLYWAGATATANSWTYTSTVSGSSTENTFPYAGHLDDTDNPTLDLCIGPPRLVYYDSPTSGTIDYTNNNIYNAYHSKYISEITDRNSKILTGYFRLRPLDIFKLSFRDRIYIDGQYYRLHKIIDYDASTETLTKVELLKVKAGVPFVPSSGIQLIDGVLYDSNLIPDSRQ